MKIKTKIPLGQEDHLEQDPRYFLQNAERAMRGDIIRGLVELITNSDDSYGRLEDDNKSADGGILIGVERRRSGKNSVVKITDRAEGMSLDDMISKLKRVGGITSGFQKSQRVRGLMGRGSKELVVFGKVKYESINNDIFSEINIYKPDIFNPIRYDKATEEDRKRLSNPRGNGTEVTLEVEPKYRIPTHQVLMEKLTKYYSLRDVLSSPQRKICLKDLNNSGKPTLIRYNYPEGETMLDQEFTVPGYEKASYHFVVKRAPEKMQMTNDAYQECGILIKSSYAIHEITFFKRDIENDPYSEYYFGKLTCPFIDDLVLDYESRMQNRQPTNEDNPSRIIDPLRAEGLVNDHPFTIALFEDAAKQLKTIIEKEKEKDQEKVKKIENQKTSERLKRLAAEAGKFLQLKLGEIEDEVPFDTTGLPAGGMAIIPGGAKILKGSEKYFSIIVKPGSENHEKFVSISTSSNQISLSSGNVELFERDAQTLGNTFTVKGLEATGSAIVNLEWGSVKKVLELSVITEEESRQLLENLAFEKNNYSIRENREKTILLLAKFPEFISKDTVVNITSDNPQIVVLGHNPSLSYDPTKKLATAEIKLLGRKLHSKGIIRAAVNGVTAETNVKVVEKEPPGVQIEIRVVNEDLGDQRAVWDKNLLKINGQYHTIKRYLGGPDAEPPFPGQDTLHFRMLLAELIADNVARKVFELESIREKEKFMTFDATRFYRQHRKYMNEFLEIAHRIELPDQDIKYE